MSNYIIGQTFSPEYYERYDKKTQIKRYLSCLNEIKELREKVNSLESERDMLVNNLFVFDKALGIMFDDYISSSATAKTRNMCINLCIESAKKKEGVKWKI